MTTSSRSVNPANGLTLSVTAHTPLPVAASTVRRPTAQSPLTYESFADLFLESEAKEIRHLSGETGPRAESFLRSWKIFAA